MQPRGKGIAISTSVLGTLSLLVVGFAARDRIREEWYIWQLKSNKNLTIVEAVSDLGKMRCIRAIPHIIAGDLKVLETSYGYEREMGAFADAIAEMGPGIIPELTPRLRDSNWQVRDLAVSAIRRSGYAELAMPALIERLKDENFQVRGRAAAALGAQGSKAAMAIPHLLEGLRADRDQHSRSKYIEAIGEIGIVTDDVVKALRSVLQDEDVIIRDSASYVLEGLEKSRAPQATRPEVRLK